MSFRSRVESVRNELTKAETKVANYILQNPKITLKLSINELAVKAASSAATVTRLVKKLEINSFTTMKVMLSSDLAGKDESAVHQLDIKANESFSSISAKLSENYNKNISQTKSLLEEKNCQTTVERLLKTNNLYVFGVGASSLAATNIYQKWSRIGCHVVLNQDFEVFLTILSRATSHDTLWLISNSGETTELLQLANFAKKNNIFTIVLTQFGQNSLSKMANLTLITCKPLEPDVRVGATNSIIGQFYVIDVIFYLYFSCDFDQCAQAVTSSRKAAKEYHFRCKQ